MRKPLFTALCAAVLSAAGCQPPVGEPIDTAPCELVLSVEGTGETLAPTRSVLPGDAAFETKVTEITVLSYNASTGVLEDASYFTTNPFTLSLESRYGHDLYILVNMGDLRGSAPASRSGASGIGYSIPSYSSVSSKGIPMAAQKSVAAGTKSVTIPVRRLMAKLAVTVDHSQMASGGDPEAFTNGMLRLRQAPRLLRPFAQGGSAASSASELFSGDTDWADLSVNGTVPVSETAVIYVPENMQGTLLPGNGDQMGKTYTNAELRRQAASALCTYLEFTGEKHGGTDGVGGSLAYRFYPGGNAVTNFDLTGGSRYNITLVLTWDGMFTDGNWMVERSDDWFDTRRILVSDDSAGGYSPTLTLRLPPGVTDECFYVFYSPLGESFSVSPVNGVYPHRFYGWGFTFDGTTAPSYEGSVTTADGLSVGHVSSPAPFAVHGVTIPADDSFCYRSYDIVYHTHDRRHSATVRLEVVEPDIIISPTEVSKGWNEYGTGTAFTIRVIGGSVPLSYISVTGTDDNLYVGPFDASAGTVTCYWKNANTSGARRRAYVRFSGLDASAACTVWQEGKSTFIVNDDSDNGEADNTYD